MATPEDRLADLGLELPAPVVRPPGVHLPFTFINLRGDRAVVSGHARQAADGSLAGPYGVFGAGLTTAEGYAEAKGIGLSVLANLKAEIGELSRVTGWVRVFAMVTSAPGYAEQHLVANGFSDLLIDVFGPEVGRHARSAVGVAGLPLGFAMEIEGEVLIRP
ncbi:RidA family protein [Albimonas sp. CAU 1670]|uniref:RidA family protein n=1 Tax=Albimonas sp. CAU 1670 TaxID=3032599 RepID=UPI0023DB5ABF|nr:RidA family protein [Albimonas sp. CAU 1670]MDF2234581.1 RidA family protein [Albimonas sp. CAU 1670]